MKREYVAEYKEAEQISPDDFRVVSKVMKLTDDTTLKEIREWFVNNHLPYSEGERREIIKLTTISITQL